MGNLRQAARTGWLCLLSWCACLAVVRAAGAERRPQSVRVVYLVSADREVRHDFQKAVEMAAKDLQAWYAKQLGGPTFRLNDPVVEVVKSDKKAL